MLNPSGGVYASGAVVTATATAQSGWHFVNWTGSASGTSSAVQVTMSSNKAITANFEVNGATTPCANPTPISVSFSHDGSGSYCWVTSDDISYINSWNTTKLEINGVDFKNLWANSLPAKINGKYYITFEGSLGWSHFEAVGSAQKAINAKDQAIVKMEIYPNPASKNVTISNIKFYNEIRVFNSSGTQMFVKK